jgi:hypothetical protein
MVKDADMKIFTPRSSIDFSGESRTPAEVRAEPQPVCPAHRAAEQLRRELGRSCRI